MSFKKADIQTEHSILSSELLSFAAWVIQMRLRIRKNGFSNSEVHIYPIFPL